MVLIEFFSFILFVTKKVKFKIQSDWLYKIDKLKTCHFDHTSYRQNDN